MALLLVSRDNVTWTINKGERTVITDNKSYTSRRRCGDTRKTERCAMQDDRVYIKP